MIDKFLKAALEALTRIAVALEAIVESQGIVAGTTPPPPETSQSQLALDAPDDDDDDLDDLDDPDDDDDLGDDDDLDDDEPAPHRISVPKTKKKKKASAKKAKKKAKKKRVGKPTKEAESQFTADEVRERLKDVQINTGSAAKAKAILKKNGASTFGQLGVGRYDQVVAECDEINDEYE